MKCTVTCGECCTSCGKKDVYTLACDEVYLIACGERHIRKYGSTFYIGIAMVV